MQFRLHPSLRVSGIYLLSSPSALYVGQSVDIRSRFAHHIHLARAGTHPRTGLNGEELSCEILQLEADEAKRLELEKVWRLRFEGSSDVQPLGNKSGKLTPEQVQFVRDLKPQYGDGVIQRAAQQLGVTVATIYAIRKGRLYKDAEPEVG